MVAGFVGGAGVVLAYGFVLLARSRYAQAGEGNVRRAGQRHASWARWAASCAQPRSSSTSSR